MSMNNGSFRDPSGKVFSIDGEIYRSIFAPGVKDFEAARDAGMYRRLISAGLLTPYEEIAERDFTPEGTVHCLHHPRLPFVSYPWEWSFSMLKDAALLHLDIMEQLVPQGFWLRDASAFNVQYDGDRLRLIDTLSIGQRIPNSPWVAYRQFCAHFLAPLAMAAYGDVRTLGLWRNYIDGYPLDLAVNMLPAWRRYLPGLLMHLTLHARFQNRADRKEDLGKQVTARTPKVSDTGLIGIIRSLRHVLTGIRWKRSSKIWESYKDIRTYQAEDVAAKSEYVEKIVRRLRPGIVWDLGANVGEFSMIAAAGGAFVVSVEGDPACVEHLYQRVFHTKETKHVLPLTMDLANPSPGLGWDSCERFSLKERGPADLLLALALIHHLVFSSCVPLESIAKWVSSLTKYALIEFVPPTDPMVQKLLQNRGANHLPYDLNVFLSSFNAYFHIEDQMTLNNGRIVYLYVRKTDA
jgi:hypothetical protein